MVCDHILAAVGYCRVLEVTIDKDTDIWNLRRFLWLLERGLHVSWFGGLSLLWSLFSLGGRFILGALSPLRSLFSLGGRWILGALSPLRSLFSLGGRWILGALSLLWSLFSLRGR